MKPTRNEALLVLSEQMQDQCRAGLRDRRSDMKRIANGGADGSERDAKLIQCVLWMVLGDMHVEAYKSEADADPAAEDRP